MKKFLYLILLAMIFVGCNSDEPKANVDETIPETTVDIYGPSSSNASAIKRIISNKGVSDYVTVSNDDEKLSVSPSEKDLFMKYFPSGINKIAQYSQNTPDLENFSLDFLYVSDGKPLTIYPIYSNGWYDLTLGLFYYDENGEKQSIDFWNMQTDNWGKLPYSYLSKNKITDVTKFDVLKTEADGYTISLPKNTLFGFYVNCSDDSQAGLFYTARMNNESNNIHAASFASNGKSYIGFEDQKFGDKDLNDLICFVNPKQQLLVNPTYSDVLESIKKLDIPGEIETDIHQQEHQDWDEIKTSVHMRHCFDSIVIELPIPLDYIIEKDDFAIRVYNGYYKLEDENYYVKTIVKHEDGKTVIVIKDVNPVVINKLLDKYNDGITAEIHCYTNFGNEEIVYEYLKQSIVTIYPEFDNCDNILHISTAFDF